MTRGARAYYELGAVHDFEDSTHALVNALQVDETTVSRFRDELVASGAYADMLERVAQVDPKVDILRMRAYTTHFWLYYVVNRILQPATVIETGVWYGSSSYSILLALAQNGKGMLHSIDTHQWAGDLTGSVVPDNLRSRWRLIRGSSRDSLPMILKELSRVQIFIHDSDHSYRNMFFEFSTVWPFISDGGLIISDDTDNNKAFTDFAKSANTRPLLFSRNKIGNKMGILVKPDSKRVA